jgi:two-component system response regulator MprA
MTAPVRALVVDDDPALREALTRALRLDGYDVTAVSNGLKALEAIPEVVPDVVVLDVMMPYVGGLEVCRRLRTPATGRRSSCSRRATRSATGSRGWTPAPTTT